MSEVVTTLKVDTLAVSLPRQEKQQSVGTFIKSGVSPFQEVGPKLAERVRCLSESRVEPGRAVLYPLQNPNEVADVWQLGAGLATTAGTMSWGQLRELLSDTRHLGHVLPSGARLACQMHDQSQQVFTALVKIQWDEDGKGQHFLGQKPENDPSFSWHNGTVFMVRTS
jgi:hypothetical protein